MSDFCSQFYNSSGQFTDSAIVHPVLEFDTRELAEQQARTSHPVGSTAACFMGITYRNAKDGANGLSGYWVSDYGYYSPESKRSHERQVWGGAWGGAAALCLIVILILAYTGKDCCGKRGASPPAEAHSKTAATPAPSGGISTQPHLFKDEDSDRKANPRSPRKSAHVGKHHPSHTTLHRDVVPL